MDGFIAAGGAGGRGGDSGGAAGTALRRHRRRQHPSQRETHQQTREMHPHGGTLRHQRQELEDDAAASFERELRRLLRGTGLQCQ